MKQSHSLLQLHKAIDEYTEREGFSGVIRILQNDAVLFERSIGYADKERQLPFSASSLFTFYSLSKPFCAIALMRLWDEGLIDLNAHPSTYCAEAADVPKNVTLHHLLTHTSGLPDFVLTKEYYEKYGRSDLDMTEQLRLLLTYPAFFPAGTDTLYANINFFLLSRVIEAVSGKDYASFMKSEVFSPLGMKTALIDREGDPIDQSFVVGYEKTADGIVLPIRKDYYSMEGAGDVVGTVDDVYCLCRAIRDGLLLSPEAWRRILTPSRINAFGYGCTISCWHGKHRITHNGGSAGFRTLQIYLPEENFDVIILSNSGWGDARNVISEAIYSAFFDEAALVEKPLTMDKGYI